MQGGKRKNIGKYMCISFFNDLTKIPKWKNKIELKYLTKISLIKRVVIRNKLFQQLFLVQNKNVCILKCGMYVKWLG